MSTNVVIPVHNNPSVRKLMLRVALCMTLVLLLNGCAFIPTPARLISRPLSSNVLPRNDVKVFTIVTDERPDYIQKSNMCGSMRNAFMIRTSFVFLAHTEHLDSLVSYHLRDCLKNAGYSLTGVYPETPQTLSQTAVKSDALNREATKMAWKNKDSLVDKKEKDAARKAKKANDVDAEYSDLDIRTMGPWRQSIDVGDADYIVEIRIRSFSSDVNYLGFFAWMTGSVALSDARDPEHKILYGKRLKGYGWLFMAVTPIEAYSVPLNMAYWSVLGGIEKAVRSPEFKQCMHMPANRKESAEILSSVSVTDRQATNEKPLDGGKPKKLVVTGIPILKDIPCIGKYLFGREEWVEDYGQ